MSPKSRHRDSAGAVGDRQRGRTSRHQPVPWIAMTVVVGVFAALGAAARVANSPVFYVTKVEIDDGNQLSAREMGLTTALLAASPRTNLLWMNLRALEVRAESLPWVADASAWRSVPSTVRVLLTPRLPAVVLLRSDGRWEADLSGVVIRPALAANRLPQVSLPDGASVAVGKRLADLRLLKGVAAAVLAGRVLPDARVAVTIDSQYDICLNMRGRVRVLLGQADDLVLQLGLLRRIYAKEADIASRLAEIDLRCPEAPACTPRAPITGAAPSLPGAA